jgi:hypothetical protein
VLALTTAALITVHAVADVTAVSSIALISAFKYTYSTVSFVATILAPTNLAVALAPSHSIVHSYVFQSLSSRYMFEIESFTASTFHNRTYKSLIFTFSNLALTFNFAKVTHSAPQRTYLFTSVNAV